MLHGLDDGPMLPRRRKNLANGGGEMVFAKAHVADARRARAWLKDRISKAAKLPESTLLHEAVDVTPALADILLAEHNEKNRPVNQKRVSDYARDMRDGVWTFHSQGISLARNGTLNNGQHRLSAVVLAGVPVRMNVAFNEDSRAFEVLDTGKIRTGSDALSVAGGHKNTPALAAAARILKNVRSGGRGNLAITNQEVLELVASEPTLADWTATGVKVAHKIKGAGSSGPTVAFFLISKLSKKEVFLPEFIEQLVSGVIPRKNPILALRDGLTKGEIPPKTKRSGAHGTHVCAAVVKAWNQWTKGRVGNVTSVTWQDNESFPKPE